jgi:hypothetical protein
MNPHIKAIQITNQLNNPDFKAAPRNKEIAKQAEDFFHTIQNSNFSFTTPFRLKAGVGIINDPIKYTHEDGPRDVKLIAYELGKTLVRIDQHTAKFV